MRPDRPFCLQHFYFMQVDFRDMPYRDEEKEEVTHDTLMLPNEPQ